MLSAGTLIMVFLTVQLPVPWGHIAGKSWGDPAGRRVLAVHGELKYIQPMAQPKAIVAFV